MSLKLPSSVALLTATRLAMRSHLVFTPKMSSGVIEYWLVEDPMLGRFFRLGVVEYALVAFLDGDTTIDEAFAELSKERPDHRLSESDAIGFCQWLVEMELAHGIDSSEPDRLLRRSRVAAKAKQQSNRNPLAFRIPLFQPSTCLDWMVRRFAWLFSGMATLIGVVLFVIASGLLIRDWTRFASASSSIFATSNWLWLLMGWISLKVLHETAHGLVCKIYGGNVREAGVQFFWFIPLPYVDVTSSWRFISRWQRIHVAAAGMIIEFWVAAIAAIVWYQTDSGWLNHLAYNVVVMASLSTLMFNANPLMKFDGYYILSDLIGIPNLYAHGQRRVRAVLDRLLLGFSTRAPATSQQRSNFVLAYGWLSLFWKVTLCCSMVLVVANYAGQMKVWVIGVAAILWLSASMVKLARLMIWGRSGMTPPRFRFAVVAAIAIVGTSAGLTWLPWLGESNSPAIVDFSPPIVVRTAGSGRVAKICVVPGQYVHTDDVLLIQENPELALEIGSLRLQIQQSEIRERRFQQKGQVASQQSEAEQRLALMIELDARQIEFNELEIRAPQAGQVIHRNLDRLLGTYLKAGDEVLCLGDESKKELRMAISQDDYDTFQQRVGLRVSIDIPGKSLLDGTLERIIPRASLTPIHSALTTVHDGPLPVRPKRNSEEKSNSFELLSPCLEGIVGIDEDDSVQLFAGQRATISYRPCELSVGQYLYHWIQKVVRFETTRT
ncbi:MAG: HlyD family efflux transporter periplasmic adaptor subunit [Pirellulaceae bacterium]|nr:HlyD family efflux transporter periplasmic adaptor subunit [Pirellulaceae bacterium]